MLLQCYSCGEAVSSCVKIPCAFTLEFHENVTKLILSKDKTAYINYCMECLIEQSEEQDE